MMRSCVLFTDFHVETFSSTKENILSHWSRGRLSSTSPSKTKGVVAEQMPAWRVEKQHIHLFDTCMMGYVMYKSTLKCQLLKGTGWVTYPLWRHLYSCIWGTDNPHSWPSDQPVDRNINVHMPANLQLVNPWKHSILEDDCLQAGLQEPPWEPGRVWFSFPSHWNIEIFKVNVV